MPLSREVDYWEGRAERCVDPEGFKLADNIWKRPEQIKRLLRYNFKDEKVLEIGVGNGIVSGILRLLTGGVWDWQGTELSPRFARTAARLFSLPKIAQCDVREIPGEGYTRIIAFDSLEHVRPEHREEGYARIAKAAAPGALFFIHYSYGNSAHDKEFDHPFGLSDIVRIEAHGFALMSYDRYLVKHPNGDVEYAFLVMRK